MSLADCLRKLPHFTEDERREILAGGRNYVKQKMAEAIGDKNEIRGILREMFDTPDIQYSAVREAWEKLTENDDTFSYPRSDSKNLEEIAATIAPDFTVVEASVDNELNHAWLVFKGEARSGKPDAWLMHYADGKVEVNVAPLGEGNEGSRLYSVAGTYARNNGLVFAGDRRGISPKGIERRLENMISLALKYRSTDFLLPHPDMKLDWKDGDYEHNVEEMLNKSYSNAVKQWPWIKDYYYDFETGIFRDNSGNAVALTDAGENDFAEGVRFAADTGPGSDNPGREQESGNRYRTQKRAIFTHSVLRAARGEGRGNILEALSPVQSSRVEKDYKGVAYSTARALDGLPADQPIDRPLDGERLRALRRAAADLERPEDGVFLRITEDGEAIATGQKGQRIPESFRRFANDNGLTFKAERRLPMANGVASSRGDITPRSEPMPIEYRQDGAMYFGEGTGASLDRTGNVRFSTARTLTVDGIERPTENSNGHPIHPTGEGIRNFWRWFGDSRIVDAKGRPLVVYHGTGADFSTFDQDAEPITYESDRGKQFFTDDAELAGEYAADAEGAPNVMPAYLRMANPRVETVDILPASWWDRQPGYMWEMNVADRGHDGMVVRGQDGQTMFVTSDPTQIKSAIGNNGQFDGSNPDIRYSTPRFFSPLSKAIEQAPDRIFSTAPQFKLWLTGNAAKLGLKKDEIEWSGINDFLDLQGKGKVAKADLVAFLSENGVQVKDVVLGGMPKEGINAVRDQYAKILERVADSNDDAKKMANAIADWASDYDARDERTPSQIVEDKERGYELLRDAIDNGEIDGNEIHDAVDAAKSGKQDAKFAQYVVPGGENYRELLITLPTKEDYSTEIESLREAYITSKSSESEKIKLELIALKEKQRDLNNFKSSHFDQPNILAHLRMDDRTDADGNPTLFLQEIQSDYGQSFKKQKDAINKSVDDDFLGIVERMKRDGVLEVNCD